MIYKSFRINLILRVIIFAVSVYLFFYFANTETYLTPVLIFILSIFQIYSLIRYVDKTNRDLASFLESIRFSEFNRSFQIKGMGPSFNELNEAFNDVISDFQKVRSEKEEHFHYLQSIVQNIDVSILAYQQDGTVEMINKSAKKLFQISNITNVHKLASLSEELVNTLLSIKPGDNKLVKIQDDDDFLQLAINATEFKLKDKIVILTTIKNIQNVLEEQETESWQKLIRVLTHEIMNSITPISSLSSTLENILKPYTKEEIETELDYETIVEIHQALQTINKRSNGLLHFVNTYRNLTRIPKPNFKVTKVNELLLNIEKLMEGDLKAAGITVKQIVNPISLEISMDEQLIEQVIINLFKNAIHAMEKTKAGLITMKAFYNKRGRPTIQISDNGVGILPEVLDKIFIPFFTTKPHGSGIGLSLSRQILRLHGGSITAQSLINKETIFTLTF
jgi:nitrogen fixation/metabolism regulation signal transduction histidine kinase